IARAATPSASLTDWPAGVIAILCVFSLIFAAVSHSLGTVELVKSKYGLGLSALVTVALVVTSSLGGCARLGIIEDLVPWETYPPLLITIGVTNLYVVTNGVIDTSMDLPVQERVALGLRNISHRLMATLGLQLLVCLVGWFSGLDVLKEFCSFVAMALVADHSLQLLFMTSVLSIDFRRLELSDLHNRRVVQHMRRFSQPNLRGLNSPLMASDLAFPPSSSLSPSQISAPSPSSSSPPSSSPPASSSSSPSPTPSFPESTPHSHSRSSSSTSSSSLSAMEKSGIKSKIPPLLPLPTPPSAMSQTSRYQASLQVEPPPEQGPRFHIPFTDWRSARHHQWMNMTALILCLTYVYTRYVGEMHVWETPWWRLPLRVLLWSWFFPSNSHHPYSHLGPEVERLGGRQRSRAPAFHSRSGNLGYCAGGSWDWLTYPRSLGALIMPLTKKSPNPLREATRGGAVVYLEPRELRQVRSLGLSDQGRSSWSGKEGTHPSSSPSSFLQRLQGGDIIAIEARTLNGEFSMGGAKEERVVVAGACSEGAVWVWERVGSFELMMGVGGTTGSGERGRERVFKCKAIRDPGEGRRITALAIVMTQVGSRDRVALVMGDQSGGIRMCDVMTGTCIWAERGEVITSTPSPVRWVGTSGTGGDGEWVWWVREDGRIGCISVERAYKDRASTTNHHWDLSLEGGRGSPGPGRKGEDDEEGMVMVEMEGASDLKDPLTPGVSPYTGGIREVRVCGHRMWLSGPWGLECWDYQVRGSTPVIHRIFSNLSSVSEPYGLGGVDALAILEESVVGMA
ncbi:sterol-sensing domain of SREBP cleavage-activation-domain-containing protein, partial [Piptocephalis cylindrospora]